jgi:hypothetical protein
MSNSWKKLFGEVFRYYLNMKRRRAMNAFVRKYYREHKQEKRHFVRNIWSRNILWDFFLQGLPHSVQSEYFVPYDYYSIDLEPRLNGTLIAFALEKNMYDKTFANCGIRCPETVLRCMNYIYLDKHYRLIEDVVKHCRNMRMDVVIKPSVETGCGFGVGMYSLINGSLIDSHGTENSITSLTRKYMGNFILQRVVRQAEEISRLHPRSLNTIRAISYRSVLTNKVHVISSMLRMGVRGACLDNVSQGGIACGIDADGRLMQYGFDQFGNSFECHPDTKIIFKNLAVPSFDHVVRNIVRAADSLPHQRLLGWDFCVDEKYRAVLVEVNVGVGIWMSQVACGRPLFGKYSKEVKNYLDAIG